MSHVSATTRYPSRKPIPRERDPTRSSARPAAKAITPAARNGQGGSPYSRATTAGTSDETLRYLTSIPVSPSASRRSTASRGERNVGRRRRVSGRGRARASQGAPRGGGAGRPRGNEHAVARPEGGGA